MKKVKGKKNAAVVWRLVVHEVIKSHSIRSEFGGKVSGCFVLTLSKIKTYPDAWQRQGLAAFFLAWFMLLTAHKWLSFKKVCGSVHSNPCLGLAKCLNTIKEGG